MTPKLLWGVDFAVGESCSVETVVELPDDNNENFIITSVYSGGWFAECFCKLCRRWISVDLDEPFPQECSKECHYRTKIRPCLWV